MDVPAVSVVIPTYRRSAFLERAMGSVLGQTCGSWEMIVVDDNGDGDPHGDRTKRRVRPYLSDPRIRYVVHAENRGGSAARNTGLHAARSDYVAFLDDDDEWLDTKLARQLDVMRRADPNVALVCTGYVLIDQANRTRRVVTPQLANPLMRELLMKNAVGPTSTILCRREALLAVGGFDEGLPSMQDLDLYVRLAARYRFAAIDDPLLWYHKHRGGRIGKNVQAVASARCAFTEKHWKRIEADPEVLRYRRESDAMSLFRANRSREAAQRLGAVLWSTPHRADLVGFYVLARLGLSAPANRVRLALGRVKRGLARRLRRRPASAAKEPRSTQAHDDTADDGPPASGDAESPQKTGTHSVQRTR